MKAMRIHQYGGPDVLTCEDIPRPGCNPGEVLIKVRAIGVNPVDWKLREGYVRSIFDIPMPSILGADVAGIVEETGAGAGKFKPGDEVYSMIGLTGAYAEFVTVAEDLVAAKPRTADFVQAASVPLAALTAWQGLFDHGKLAAGQTVLVHAAAGGVGMFGVQFARAHGASVIATASANNAAFVSSLGAAKVVDFRTGTAEVSAGSVDLVLDMVGGDSIRQCLEVLKPGGKLMRVSPGSEDITAQAAAGKVDVIPVMVTPNAEQLREIAELIDAGAVTTEVQASFALEDAAQAHQLSAQGHTRGKIVLTC
ncbi:MAG: NADP-dependent oxidoreductase [Halieaceae bacterium]|nr:NADP-dependent oxidoreductase [Halieaceae bacterium]